MLINEQMMQISQFVSLMLLYSIFPFLKIFLKKEDLTFSKMMFILFFLFLVGCKASYIENHLIYYWLMVFCYPMMGVVAIWSIARE